jgi:hypothetical protein
MNRRIVSSILYFLTATVTGVQLAGLAGLGDLPFFREILEYRYGQWGNVVLFAAFLGAIMYGVAILLTLFTARFGRLAGCAAACLAWPYFAAWTVTCPWREFFLIASRSGVTITIGSLLLLIAASAYSFGETFPRVSPWMSKSGRTERIWPMLFFGGLVALGLVVGLIILRPKVIVDGVRARVAIAHVKKAGGEVQETNIFVMRDHRYFLERVHRQFFWLYPECRQFQSALSEESFRSLMSLTESTEFGALRTSRAAMPSAWNSDTWYISVPREQSTQFLAFSNVDRAIPRPPEALTAWFNETEKLSPSEISAEGTRECTAFSNETVALWRR